jgi:hypothetical protein
VGDRHALYGVTPFNTDGKGQFVFQTRLSTRGRYRIVAYIGDGYGYLGATTLGVDHDQLTRRVAPAGKPTVSP